MTDRPTERKEATGCAPSARPAGDEATGEGAGLREAVRQRYADAALRVTGEGGSACCGAPAGEGGDTGETGDAGGACRAGDGFGPRLYAPADRAALPAEAVAASLGCGNPTAVAELREGDRVLDLGSGGGIDVLLSARRVGPTGKAYGLDMTEEMLALAVANREKAGIRNAEFLKGTIEAVPLPAAGIDVVISNCVINLSTDKAAVFAEIFRVLVPGGRIGISDVVADDDLSPAQRAARGPHVDCIAGALSFGEYRRGLEAAGFTGVRITPTHPVADRMHSALVRAVKPGADEAGRGTADGTGYGAGRGPVSAA